MTSSSPRHDLAVAIVSANDAEWLPACLTSLAERLASIRAEVVVVDNGCTDDTARVVEESFPEVRLVRTDNRGFAAGNNAALATCDARYVLFLNPDTQILDGDFAELFALLDARPDVGLLGCLHLMPHGRIQRTMRRLPSPARVWSEALGAGGPLPLGLGRLGEVVYGDEPYAREAECGWVAGSFMLVRAEAIAGAGYMDERFFLYSEETDFCLRVAGAGWRVMYSPRMTILHHAGKAGVSPKLEAQKAFARCQYAGKHFGPVGRVAFRLGLAAHYALRLAASLGGGTMRRRHRVAARCLRVSLGLEGSPFPPAASVAVRRLDRAESGRELQAVAR